MNTKYGNITDDHIRFFIEQVIERQVRDVRKRLALKYDVKKGDFKNYTNLCDEAVNLFIEGMENYKKVEARNVNLFSVEKIHGEQRPHPRLRMCDWATEHTWAVVYYRGESIYVDPTSGQFSDFYFRMPEYYISTEPPKWFLPDEDNDASGRDWNWRERIFGFFSDLIGKIFGLQKPQYDDEED
ncbi:MAG: hypothetical protein NC131_09995 [Roseburia sp.]|nr:hypothetical protein [Roseburia sp.]